ncbi:MAG: hypothetical protein SO314_07075 [Alphaproteobacteria bacterium]|nr:hypothetical protein [Alphaproteobacteria bacterium]
MSVGLPFWLLFGTQKVTIKNKQLNEEIKTRKLKKKNSSKKRRENGNGEAGK